ncbi:MAG TPA: M20/M25/M40 family metallo-hydrolase [Bacteroidales bacterium]|nr:M20/M25/M40 family metallo-hydrolase [Bacteroidales bacterium]
MKGIRGTFLLLILFASIRLEAQGPDDALLMDQYHLISELEINSWVEKMCSPEYKGRLTGTSEYMNAAGWLAGKLNEWGVKPGGDNGTYFQCFDRPWVEVKDRGEIKLLIPQKNEKTVFKEYLFPDDAVVGMATGSGQITADVVFAGYGITAPELGYDDYSNVDVRNKIVLINRDVPYKDISSPEYKKWVKYCYHIEKLQNAVKHGARGLLYMDGNSANPNIAYDPSIIVFGISQTVTNDIFALCNRDVKEIFNAIDRDFKPGSFNTGIRMSLKANSVYHPEGRGCSVIGIIPGSDPALKEESIVVGGHFDGVGFIGNDIFPGAWDNASGVADMMGALKAIALSGIKPKRSIVFIFTGGEEVGLLGSKEYINHPLLPLDKILCYINLDMPGNGTGIGFSNGLTYPDIISYFEQANKQYTQRLFAATEKRPFYGRPRSDAGPFEEAGVKNMSLFITGAYKEGFYHLPGDTPETITTEVMEDVAKILYIGLIRLADK